MQRFVSCIAVATCMLFAGAAQGQVVIDWVTVGDPGNVGELSGAGADPPGFGNDRICGAVDYVYRIGKYEVTNGQYREFLNAAAALGDPNNLYHPSMSTHGGIVRSGDGTPGTPYTYAARDGDATWDSHPVNFISWYDALRFANWLHNGQPVGEQDTDTTEDGAYEMSLGSSVVRKLGARAFLPTEDEWYKAAYYKGGASAGYWNYATQSDTAPTAQAPPGTDMVNGSANYAGLSLPYTTSAVGAYSAKPSDSAYGTFDQGGNIYEWNETPDGVYRGLRGGTYHLSAAYLPAYVRNVYAPSQNEQHTGFRVASPNPDIPAVSEWGLVTMALLVLSAGTVVMVRRRMAE